MAAFTNEIFQKIENKKTGGNPTGNGTVRTSQLSFKVVYMNLLLLLFYKESHTEKVQLIRNSIMKSLFVRRIQDKPQCSLPHKGKDSD